MNPGIMQFLRANGAAGLVRLARRAEAGCAAADAWFDAPDLAAQRKIAGDIQQMVFEEAPYLPSGQYFASHRPSAEVDHRARSRRSTPSGRCKRV